MFERPNVQTPPLDLPAAGAGEPRPKMFTMPKEFRGQASRGVSVSVPSASAPTSAVVAKPTPPPTLATSAAPTVKPPASAPHGRRGLLIAGGVLVVALAVAGVIVWRATSTPPRVPEVPVVERPVTTPPVPVVAPPVEKPSTPTPPASVPSSRLGRDSDSDGLADVEEGLYGTNPRISDTDLDGFLDGNEVFHRYDPNGPTPKTLEESGLVKPLDLAVPYTFLYPSLWSAKTGAQGPATVISAVTGETFTFTVEPKAVDQTAQQWVEATYPQEQDALESFTNKDGRTVLLREHQLVAYVDLGEQMLIAVYQLTGTSRVDYQQTFLMMLNTVRPYAPL